MTPAPGEPGKLPFWHGDTVGRPIELGRALGAFVRELEADIARGDRGRRAALRAARRAATTSTSSPPRTCVAYLEDEHEATGALPTDRRIVVERFRDELGDWRVCILTPFGARVHAPWSLALEARLGERLGAEVQTIWTDDGIAVRLPEGDLDGVDDLLFPDRRRDRGPRRRVRSRTRRCSRRGSARTPPGRCSCRAAGRARARRSGSSASARRTCWPWPAATARSRSSSRPTASACRTSSTCRRCARSWPAWTGARSRSMPSRPRAPTPFASSLLFDYVAAYMYEGDAPTGRAPRAGPHARPRPAARAARPGGAARAARSGGPGRPRAGAPGPGRRPPRDDRRPGPRPAAPARRPDGRRGRGARARAARASPPNGCATSSGHGAPSASGSPARRAGSRSRMSARYRDAVGVAAAGGRAGGIPRARRARRSKGCSRAGRGRTGRSSRRIRRAAGACRWASWRMPWSACSRTGRWCVASSGRVAPSANGATRTSCASCGGDRWRGCAARSSRSSRRRWRGSCRPGRASPSAGSEPPPLRGTAALERLAEVVDQLAGVPIPASVLERDVLPVRVPGYQPRLLDELGAMGEVGWVGRGSLGRDDGRIVLFRPGREVAPRARRRGRATLEPPVGPAARADPRAGSRDAARASTARSTRRPAADPTARSSTRSGISSGPARSRTTRSRPCARSAGGGPSRDPRRRPSRLTSLGPPEAAGRWSLVAADVAVDGRGHGARPDRAAPRAGRWPSSSVTAS